MSFLFILKIFPLHSIEESESQLGNVDRKFHFFEKYFVSLYLSETFSAILYYQFKGYNS